MEPNTEHVASRDPAPDGDYFARIIAIRDLCDRNRPEEEDDGSDFCNHYFDE